MAEDVPKVAADAVLVHSSTIPGYEEEVKGYDWSKGIDYEALLNSYTKSGFQATNYGLAVNEINRMISARNETIIDKETGDVSPPPNCKIFLGYTSNLISSGLRDTIRFLVQHKLVDCIVTTAGGIEEDFIKCLGPTLVGDFSLKGTYLRDNGMNRIGNLLVPNENYCKFQEWVYPILDEMLKEQIENGKIWTPSKIIAKLGEKINNERSVYYWAWKNQIPVYSPALTDGSLGDMMYFRSYNNDTQLIVDILGDLRALNSSAVFAKKTGMIILGGGLIKHHICNANLMRNGAEYAVFINTGQEFDGSDSGARPDEAVSWGKIKKDAHPVKLYADATLVFPLIVAQTFAKEVYK